MHHSFWNLTKHGSDVKTQHTQSKKTTIPNNNLGAKAFVNEPASIREALCLQHFLNGIDVDLAIQLQRKEVTTLNEAVSVAIKEEMWNKVKKEAVSKQALDTI